MFRAFAIIYLCLIGAAEAQDTHPNIFEGRWVNDRDSAVHFQELAGVLSGYYQTALGQPDKSREFPLTGFVEGDQITFTVNFKGYGSMTSWTGQMTRDAKGKDIIPTLWNLTRDVPDAEETDELWKSITSGASTFRREADIQPNRN